MSRDFFDIGAYQDGDDKQNRRKKLAKENEESRFDKPDLDDKSTPKIFSKGNSKGLDLYNPESYDPERAKKNIREINTGRTTRNNSRAIRKIDFNEELNKRSNSKGLKSNSDNIVNKGVSVRAYQDENKSNKNEEKSIRANKRRRSKMESIESAASIYRLEKSTTEDSTSNRKGQAPRTYSQRSSGLYESKLHSKESAKRPELINLSKKEEASASKQLKSRNNLLYISIVVIIAFFIALFNVLNAQSEVVQVNYDNAAIQNRTNRLAMENAERLERIARNRNLEDIAIAAQNQGFIYPNTQQMVIVEQDDDDLVILYNEDSNALGVSTDAVDMEDVYDRIEAYVLSGEESSDQEDTRIEADDAVSSEPEIVNTSSSETDSSSSSEGDE